MINYKWIIPAIDYAVKENNLEKVVKTIHWRYKGTDNKDENISYEIFGAQQIENPETGNYIPYEDLTEEIIIKWLEEKIDIQNIQKIIEENIQNLKNPPIVTDINPFNQEL